MLTSALILEKLQPLSKVEGFSAASAFLQASGTRRHEGGSDGRVTVKQTRDIWGYRFERAKKGVIRPIPGLEHLVGALSSLPADTILKSVIFENGKSVSVFWFDDQITSPIGFVVCEATTAIASTQT